MSSPESARVQRIVRVRTGCMKCRVRKKKCDELRPVCRACERNGFVCKWPSKDTAAGRSRRRHRPPEAQLTEPPSGTWSAESSPDDSNGAPDAVLDENAALDIACVPASPALRLGGHDLNGAKSGLLEYYLHRTAESMSNGFHATNPFIVQLIPAAFSSDLILQLILGQSASHRAAQSVDDGVAVSSLLYAESIQCFQHSINKYVVNDETDAFPLALGTLIMCYTETARGDVTGTLFNHLVACPTLLLQCLDSATQHSAALGDFLVEYYFYTAAVSLISLDASAAAPLLLFPQLTAHAALLAASGYCGNLCGCWLGILLLLPQIFDLGREVVQDGGPLLSAGTVARYASLHRQLLEWTPPPPPPSAANSHTRLAAQAYRQAALLYLYTAVAPPPPPPPAPDDVDAGHDDDDRHAALVRAAVADALDAVRQLPAAARVNTNMCWPLAVVGSYLFDAGQQGFVRARLQAMVGAIGLGNIAQTARLLECMWASGSRGPWGIGRAMRENGIWISFA